MPNRRLPISALALALGYESGSDSDDQSDNISASDDEFQTTESGLSTIPSVVVDMRPCQLLINSDIQQILQKISEEQRLAIIAKVLNVIPNSDEFAEFKCKLREIAAKHTTLVERLETRSKNPEKQYMKKHE